MQITVLLIPIFVLFQITTIDEYDVSGFENDVDEETFDES